MDRPILNSIEELEALSKEKSRDIYRPKYEEMLAHYEKKFEMYKKLFSDAMGKNILLEIEIIELNTKMLKVKQQGDDYMYNHDYIHNLYVKSSLLEDDLKNEIGSLKEEINLLKKAKINE